MDDYGYPVYSAAEAVKDIFTGKWRCRADDGVYGFALEGLCWYLGERLNDGVFCGNTDVMWFDRMDAWLKSEEAPLCFSDLVFHRPLALPQEIDGASIGHWTPRQIRAAAPAVYQLSSRPGDGDFIEAIRQVREWFDSALKEPDLCLVGFYY